MSPFVLPPFVLSTTVALREASGVAPNRGHSAMKVRADRETCPFREPFVEFVIDCWLRSTSISIDNTYLPKSFAVGLVF
jgi:hypothetical protein